MPKIPVLPICFNSKMILDFEKIKIKLNSSHNGTQKRTIRGPTPIRSIIIKKVLIYGSHIQIRI